MVQLPDRMPAHHSDEVFGSMFGAGLELGLDSHKIIGHGTGDNRLHDMRGKLDRRSKLPGWPPHLPPVIGQIQVLTVTHGPWTPPVSTLVHWKTGHGPA